MKLIFIKFKIIFYRFLSLKKKFDYYLNFFDKLKKLKILMTGVKSNILMIGVRRNILLKIKDYFKKNYIT